MKKYLFILAIIFVSAAGFLATFGFNLKDSFFSNIKPDSALAFFHFGSSDYCREITYHYGFSRKRMTACQRAFDSWRGWGFNSDDEFHPIWTAWVYWEENTEKPRPPLFDDWLKGVEGMLSSWRGFLENYNGPLDQIKNPCHEVTLYYATGKLWRNYSNYYNTCEENFDKFEDFDYNDPNHPLWLFWQQWEKDEDDSAPPRFEQWAIGAGLLAASVAAGGWDFTGGAQSFTTSLPGFGGNIAQTIPCTCSRGDIMFYVTPVPGSWSGPYIVNIGSDVHLNGNVTPGSWVLGNVTPGGVCMMNASFGCYGIPAMYDIQPRPAGLGTS